MLGWMRKQTKSWFVYLAFGIIMVVFVFFYGWRGRGTPGQASVAEVNGQKITSRQYEENYESLLKMSRNLYNKKSFTDDEIKQLRQRALDDLVEKTLLLQEAERLGIQVGSDETKREIASNPAFWRNGRFDKALYLRQLSDNRMSPTEFEEAVRINRTITKLMNTVRDTTKLSNRELFDLYRFQNEKVNLQFMKINARDFDGKVTVTDGDLAEYFEGKKENYRVPERVRARYLTIETGHYRDRVEVTPGEVEEYYRLNAERFFREKQVRARHILIAVDKKAGGAAEEAARKKAEDIRKKVESGEDFAMLAKRFSQDPATAEKGGDLGFFKRGQMVKAFDDVAFSLGPGEVSPVVRTPFGYHIIKVVSLEEEKTEPLEKVKDTIAEEIGGEKADGIARREARRAESTIFRGGDLQAYATENGFTVRETGLFARGEPVGDIGLDEECNGAVFALGMNEVSPVVRVGKKYYIFQLVERKPTYLPDLSDVRESVTGAVRRKKAREAARKGADRLLGEIAAGSPLVEVARREGLSVEETGFFTRQDNFIGKIGSLPALVKDAFTLTRERPVPGEVYNREDAFFVVRLKEKEEPGQDALVSEREKVRGQLVARKREERTRLWLDNLKAGSDTKIFVTP